MHTEILHAQRMQMLCIATSWNSIYWPILVTEETRHFMWHTKWSPILFTWHTASKSLSIWLFWFYNVCLHWKTNTMKQNPSWEAESSPIGQEMLCILWNQLAHHLHKSPPFIPDLSRWIQPTPPYISLTPTLILSSHLCLSLPTALYIKFPHQNPVPHCITLPALLST
jgi:hypothetical protein